MKIRDDAGAWVDEEFETLDLGDPRRDRRAKELVKRFASRPTASIPGACEDWAETMAAYRFLGNERIDWRDMMQPHWDRTTARMGKLPVVLCIADTTELNFNGQDIEGAGPLSYEAQVTPKKKARQAIKAKIRDIIRHGGSTPAAKLIAKLNVAVAGWVNYFRVGNASRAFSEVRDYLEMKVRTLLTRRKRRQKRSVGWRRWSNEYLYGVLGLYWDWKTRPLSGAEEFA